MTNTLKKLAPFCFLFLVSCKTYTMSREALYTQIHDATPVDVNTSHNAGFAFNGFRDHISYQANGVVEIACFDKKGNAASIANSPRVEMRIKADHHKTYNFYFDTIILKDSVFTGVNSRILGTKRSVRFADIKSVHLQKGAKKYNYQN